MKAKNSEREHKVPEGDRGIKQVIDGVFRDLLSTREGA